MNGVSLAWLLDGIVKVPAADAAALSSVRVADITLDSREVRGRSLFFALRGARVHGLQFAEQAAARGASVLLWDPDGAPEGGGDPGYDLGGDMLRLAVPGLAPLVGRIADRFFGWPSEHLRIVGITGTNGKTTCAFLLAQCLARLGSQAAYIGTLGWGRIEELQTPTHTTPDVISVHRQLAALRAQGVRDVAMEVSSHALDQGRLNGVRLHSAAFTNLTRDHLDYHGTMQAYGAAKARLFARGDLKHIVSHVGDAFGRELALQYRGRAPLTAVWVGAGGAGWLADQALYAEDVSLDLTGLSMTVAGSAGTARVHTRLLGRFNVENAVVVLACLVGLGAPLAAAAAALSECAAPPGRMEVVAPAGADAGGKPTAVIDYAHTPDALAKALSAAREHCRGLLWCVFGCGGDRDPGKRPLMGAVADELADQIIVTDDNPRSEDPAAITQDISAGITARAARVIHDRGTAIATALTEAQAADLVLIAGKGHEDYQIYGTLRRDFSDKQTALKCLEAA